MSSALYKKGMKEMRRHLGSAADKWISSIKEIAPEFAKVNVEFPFGELYTRDVLDDKTRNCAPSPRLPCRAIPPQN